MTYPTTYGVVAFFSEREPAAVVAGELAAAVSTGGGAADVSGQPGVVLHTAVAGHQGEWTAVVRAVGDAERLAAVLRPEADQGLYAAEFRRIKAHPVDWAPGEATPGIGLLFAARRRPDLTHEEFDAHWRDRHAPLALRHHVGMWDYTQCSFTGRLDDTAPEIDGLAICKFATVEDYKERFYDSDEGRAAIGADVARFSDVGASGAMRMTELVLV
jgi:uncharacterized protein (TIGR02118 family)